MNKEPEYIQDRYGNWRIVPWNVMPVTDTWGIDMLGLGLSFSIFFVLLGIAAGIAYIIQ